MNHELVEPLDKTSWISRERKIRLSPFSTWLCYLSIYIYFSFMCSLLYIFAFSPVSYKKWYRWNLNSFMNFFLSYRSFQIEQASHGGICGRVYWTCNMEGDLTCFQAEKSKSSESSKFILSDQTSEHMVRGAARKLKCFTDSE